MEFCSGMTTQRGGPGRNQGRKTNASKGLATVTPADYSRPPIPRSNLSEREAAALEWFEGLEPFERLQVIVKIYYS